MTNVDTAFNRTIGELPSAPLARWAAIFFSLFVLTIQTSIAASQTLLAVAGVLYLIHVVRARPAAVFVPVKLPLALFCVFSLISIFLATNPTTGWFAFRKLVLFLIWFLAVNLVVSANHLRRLIMGFILVSLVTSLVGIGQFVAQYRRVRVQHPTEVYRYLTTTRIHGLMGHWMHFGGQQMLVFIFLLAFLLLAQARKSKTEFERTEAGSRAVVFWWMLLALVALSIVLNFTRGVWLGCSLAVVYLVARWKPKMLLALPILLVLGYLGAPSMIRERVHLAMHPRNDPALSIRLEMWHVALNMIRAHPWVGVGPNNIEEVYGLYLPPGPPPEVGYHNHFHNDFLQFGAERGLPCLASWIWLMAALGWYTWKARRKLSGLGWVADAAFAVWIAFLAEGCFEFNFGTSPVLMAFLFVTATPFIAERIAARDGEESDAGNSNA